MKISIDDPQQKFDEHLKLPDNSRILFSGKFGTGKSHFLKEYFQHHNDKYSVFTISPVNYVVGANQDIFEWIKIDIAEQLLRNYLVDDKSEDFSKSLLIQTYVYNNPGVIITTLLTRLGNLLAKTKTGVDALDTFKHEVSKYKEFEKAVKDENKSEFEHLQHYINTSTQIKGSIRENDLITRIIRASIEWVKYQQKKEIVLIIDDLDRLDPEHIFRILNILSAHNDHFDSNKFGFQKVILVCDIENIKHLYEYRYGTKADFDGYIEKFYTYQPFNYSILDSTLAYFQDLVLANELDRSSIVLLNLILMESIKLKLLNIRNLRKIVATTFQKTLSIKSYEINLKEFGFSYENFIATDKITIDYNNYKVINALYILSHAFGGIDKMQLAFVKISDANSLIKPEYHDAIIDSIFMISHISKTLATNDTFFTISRTGPRLFIMMHPHAHFMNKEISIRSHWSNFNPYNEGHYFNENFNKNKLIELKNQGGIEVKWSNIFQEISPIIQFIKKEKLLENV